MPKGPDARCVESGDAVEGTHESTRLFGVVTASRELYLELLLVLRDGQLAHRARRTDSGTAPSAVRGTAGELAIADAGTRLLTGTVR
jgi:hypothetical protein